MFKAIVVGTDGSDTAGQAVRQAVDLARAVRRGDQCASAAGCSRACDGKRTLKRVGPVVDAV